MDLKGKTSYIESNSDIMNGNDPLITDNISNQKDGASNGSAEQFIV